jgi:hypothetical protein
MTARAQYIVVPSGRNVGIVQWPVRPIKQRQDLNELSNGIALRMNHAAQETASNRSMEWSE